jgi:tetratricopeptide (TPR) repeat protein
VSFSEPVANIATGNVPQPPPAVRGWRPRPSRLLLAGVFVAVLLAAASFVTPWYRARHDWSEAQDALRRHDLSAAADRLDRYLQRRPNDADAWLLSARVARRRDDLADAERRLERCQQIAGVTPATRLEWDLIRVQSGNLGDAEARLRSTIGPDHPDALLVLEALAKGYLKCERLADALQACDLWVGREPVHPWPWLCRGRVLERTGHFDPAEESFRRALAAAPKDRETLLELGKLFLNRRRKPDEAAGYFEGVLRQDASNTRALLGLASCRVEQGRPGEADALLDKVSAEAAGAEGLFLRGKAAWLKGDTGPAVSWLRRAVALAPDNADALNLLVQCLRQQDEREEADRLAERHEQLRQGLRRLDDLTRAVALNPDDVAARSEAGALALRLGRPDEALRWLRGALQVKGDHRPAHAALADYYQQAGEPASAQAHRRLAEGP